MVDLGACDDNVCQRSRLRMFDGSSGSTRRVSRLGIAYYDRKATNAPPCRGEPRAVI